MKHTACTRRIFGNPKGGICRTGILTGVMNCNRSAFQRECSTGDGNRTQLTIKRMLVDNLTSGFRVFNRHRCTKCQHRHFRLINSCTEFLTIQVDSHCLVNCFGCRNGTQIYITQERQRCAGSGVSGCKRFSKRSIFRRYIRCGCYTRIVSCLLRVLCRQSNRSRCAACRAGIIPTFAVIGCQRQNSSMGTNRFITAKSIGDSCFLIRLIYANIRNRPRTTSVCSAERCRKVIPIIRIHHIKYSRLLHRSLRRIRRGECRINRKVGRLCITLNNPWIRIFRRQCTSLNRCIIQAFERNRLGERTVIGAVRTITNEFVVKCRTCRTGMRRPSRNSPSAISAAACHKVTIRIRRGCCKTDNHTCRFRIGGRRIRCIDSHIRRSRCYLDYLKRCRCGF